VAVAQRAVRAGDCSDGDGDGYGYSIAEEGLHAAVVAHVPGTRPPPQQWMRMRPLHRGVVALGVVDGADAAACSRIECVRCATSCTSASRSSWSWSRSSRSLSAQSCTAVRVAASRTRCVWCFICVRGVMCACALDILSAVWLTVDVAHQGEARPLSPQQVSSVRGRWCRCWAAVPLSPCHCQPCPCCAACSGGVAGKQAACGHDPLSPAAGAALHPRHSHVAAEACTCARAACVPRLSVCRWWWCCCCSSWPSWSWLWSWLCVTACFVAVA
jgi:hypothetical protein